MPCDRPRLAPLYEAAEYRVRSPWDEIVLRVGQPNAALDRLLARMGAASLSCITAFNPASTPLPPGENRARQARLARRVAGMGLRTLPGINRDPAARWPDEETLCILDIAAKQARTLAREFGQCALLRVERGRAPFLLWSDEA